MDTSRADVPQGIASRARKGTMNILAHVASREGHHAVTLRTGAATRTLNIAPKPTGPGSSVSGGELLFLALATCYCNDLYREAARRGVGVEAVKVEVSGVFGAEGQPATDIRYDVRIVGWASDEELRSLAQATDQLAEVQATLRASVPVVLQAIQVVSRA
jgi:uncharacterized OsmC-like protein